MHPAPNMRLISNNPAIKSIPVEGDWACDVRGASRQEMVLLVCYEFPLD